MIHKENLSFIEFCVDMNETENCRLKMEEDQSIIKKLELVVLFIFLFYWGWFLGRHSFCRIHLKKPLLALTPFHPRNALKMSF